MGLSVGVVLTNDRPTETSIILPVHLLSLSCPKTEKQNEMVI